jgi:hypothetical protein
MAKGDHMTQVEGIAALVEARRAVLDATGRIPAQQRERPFLGTWSLVDLLAHLAGWDEANLLAAHEVMEGRMPSFYAHVDPDWRTFNAILVAEHRRDSFDELLQHVRETHERLVEGLQAVPAAAFHKDFGVRFRGYKVTIARLAAAEAGDERTHCEQILGFVRALEDGASAHKC